MHLNDTTLQQQATSVFARMPIMLDAINLMNRIQRETAGLTDLTSLSIRVAIENQVPFVTIIKQLQEQVNAGVGRIFSTELLQDIVKFKG